MNEELNKFKKTRKLFGLIVCGLSLPISAAFLFYIFFSNDKFGKLDAVVYGIYLCFIIAVLISFIVFDVKRTKLIRKYFGKVSAEDAELAKDLYKQAKSFKDKFKIIDNTNAMIVDLENKKVNAIVEYNSLHYYKSYDAVRFVLRFVKLKRKINISWAENLKKLELFLERVDDYDFTNYINKLIPLLERNITEI